MVDILGSETDFETGTEPAPRKRTDKRSDERKSQGKVFGGFQRGELEGLRERYPDLTAEGISDAEARRLRLARRAMEYLNQNGMRIDEIDGVVFLSPGRLGSTVSIDELRIMVTRPPQLRNKFLSPRVTPTI